MTNNKNKQDHYESLGVDKTATPAQVKAAHRRAAKKAHPDAGGEREEFLAVQLAYEVLSDGERRARYDAGGDDSGKAVSRAFDVAAHALAAAVEASVSGFVGDRLDVLLEARANIVKKEQAAGEQRRHLEAKAKQYRRRAERIKRKDGENALRAVLENRAAEIGLAALKAEEDEKLMAEASRCFDGYTYEFPAPKPTPASAWHMAGLDATNTTTT